MVLDLLDPQTLGRLIGVFSLMIMAAAAGYAKGHKDGHREGYIRGKAVSRHMTSFQPDIIAIPSDIKVAE